MADNTQLPVAATSGDVAASDDIAGVKYQRVKITLGADGVNDGDVASGNALPVTGTVAATQSGTWTVQPGNTANTTAWKVDGSAVTQPVSDASGSLTVDAPVATPVFVRLSDGAAAIATLPVSIATAPALVASSANIGDVDVLTIAAGDNNIGNVDIVTMPNVTLAAGTNTNEVVGDVAHDAPAAGNPVLLAGYASAAAPTDVSGDADAVRLWCLRNGAQATVLTAAGALIGGDATNGLDCDITRLPALVAGTAAIGKLAANSGVDIGDVDVTSVPTDPFGANADAASATGSISAKLRFIAATGIPVTGTVTVGSHAVTNAGTFATQVDGNALTALQLIDDTVFVDDAAFTAAASKVNAIGLVADESSTDSVDEGDIGAPRMTLDRKQITTNYAHAAAGGCTPHQNLDVDETEDDVKTTAGKLFWLHAVNLTATKLYLKIYNATAANVSVGSTTPLLTFLVPTMGDTNGAGFTINFGSQGTQFDTAICIAATTGFAVADTGAPATNACIVNLGYL